MGPPGQGLEADDLAGVQIDQRLIVGDDLAAGDRLAQRPLDAVSLADGLVHMFLEEAQGGALLALGPVEGDIGLAHHLGLVVAVLGDQRDADGRADLMAPAIGQDGILQLLDDAQGDGGGGVGARQMRRQHGELIAPEPGHHVVLAHRGLQPRGHADQHLVAHRMTVDVVDPLEPVEVEQQHPVRAAGPGRGPQRRLQRVLELAAVGQSGERILHGQAPHLVLGRHPALVFAIAEDVAEKDDQPAQAQRQDGEHLLDGDGPALRPCPLAGVEDVELPDHEDGRRQHRQEIDGRLQFDPVAHHHPAGLRQRCAKPHPAILLRRAI